MASREIGVGWDNEYKFREEVRSGRSVSEIGVRTYYHNILCDVVQSGRRTSTHSVLWLLWGVYCVY